MCDHNGKIDPDRTWLAAAVRSVFVLYNGLLGTQACVDNNTFAEEES